MKAPVPTNTSPTPPTFAEALRFWLRLGFIGFGGPAGQIAILHEFLVDKKRWISDHKFLHALQYCMLLPGPEAQQLATYTGWLLHGTRGGLAAGILFVLPSAFMLWGLSFLYVSYGRIAAVQAIFELLKPAVLAIVVGAVLKIGKKSLHGPLYYGVAVAAFVGIYFFDLPFPLIVMGALLLGLVVWRFFPDQLRGAATKTAAQATEETEYVVNRYSSMRYSGFSAARLARQVGLALLLWGLGWAALRWYDPSGFAFWENLAVFFTKAAFVTFGGAYAVLPYVAQAGVEQFGWLTSAQMIDGLALGETTPGPLIMVLAFVGFMAGYSTFAGSLTAATVGLVATVFYTFLPSFLFIFVGAPLIERTQANPLIGKTLGLATAAVTGVVFSLALYFGKAVILPTPGQVAWLSLLWAVVSLLALQRFKIGMIIWIGVSMVAGLLKYVCTGMT